MVKHFKVKDRQEAFDILNCFIFGDGMDKSLEKIPYENGLSMYDALLGLASYLADSKDIVWPVNSRKV
jgi:hypothetical protein